MPPSAWRCRHGCANRRKSRTYCPEDLSKATRTRFKKRGRDMARPVVIAVAITGSVPRKKDNPALPVTPSEQVESTHEAFEAGATICHIHVRNPDESSSSDPKLFQQVQEGINKHCPG